MMRYAIPEYRLPKAVLEEDLKYLWQLGVKFEGGKLATVKELVGKYDSILIATGNALSRKLRIEGAEMTGVLWGLDFLRSIRKGEKVVLKGKVVVMAAGPLPLTSRAARRDAVQPKSPWSVLRRPKNARSSVGDRSGR